MFDNLLAPGLETEATTRRPAHHGLRIIAGLFRKLILIKIRRPSAIVEFLLGTVIWLVLYVVWKLARVTWPGEEFPTLNTTQPPYELAGFFAVTEEPILVLVPDCPSTRSLLAFLNATLVFTNGSQAIDLNPHFVNTTDDMESLIYSHISNGVGIHWENALAPDAFSSPNITLYMQAFIFAPQRDLFELISLWIGNQNPNETAVWPLMQEFATPPTLQLFQVMNPTAFFTAFPIILATMPDLQAILDEKDSRVQTLTFLMGCSELSYWGVSFLMQFILAMVPYTLMCVSLTAGFMMKGTSFTLFYTISILYVVSHIWFQMFITTFMKRAVHGRVLTVTLIILIVFFSNLHRMFTLDETNQIEASKHIFSIIPMSAYEMVTMVFAEQCRQSYPAVQWSDLNNDTLAYRPWYALLWLSIDSILYCILFILSNLTMARDFGSPLIRWRELFSRRAWRRVLIPRSPSALDSSARLIQVDGLCKTYEGEREVIALTDVSFWIDPGEVIVVIGPNGAGKSTLMNILAGAVEPSAGELRIAGGPPTTRFKEIQQFLGVCFQENVLIGLLTIREHFHLFGRFRRMEDAEIEHALEFFSQTLQLTAMLNNRAVDLSGGQKRKLCVALSLLGRPRIVIMDEPTAGVDVQARQLIWKTIASLRETTTLVTSHALEEAEAVSSRLFVVAGGRLPFAGTSTEMRNQFNCGYVLRIEGDAEPAFALAREMVPRARRSARADTIAMPVCPEVPNFVRELQARSADLGIASFSFGVEQLEDVMLKLIQTEEATFEGRP
jgi:ABC-type multidrug transport system ATPase subunit